MKLIEILIAMVFLFAGQIMPNPVNSKNLIQFGNMIKEITGKNPLAFDAYGNYCGKGGSGIPLDAIDNCCKIHDQCYDNLKNCIPHLVTYKYDITNKKITCLTEMSKECGYGTCICDKQAVECFEKNLNSYNDCLNNALFGITWFKPDDCKKLNQNLIF